MKKWRLQPEKKSIHPAGFQFPDPVGYKPIKVGEVAPEGIPEEWYAKTNGTLAGVLFVEVKPPQETQEMPVPTGKKSKGDPK